LLTSTALAGVDAADGGQAGGDFYPPVWTSSVFRPTDFRLALIAFVARVQWELPPWLALLCSGEAARLLTTVL